MVMSLPPELLGQVTWDKWPETVIIKTINKHTTWQKERILVRIQARL